MSALRLGSWLLLYLGAALALLVEAGCLGRPSAPALERLPGVLGPLELLEELAFDPAALGSAPPERFTYRRVRATGGREGRLFIAYYERAQRWSGRPHDVEKCFAASGWEEREAHRLEEAHRPWSRSFERPPAEGRAAGADGGEAPEAIRVVHWLERPGPDADRMALGELGRRLASGRGFRPDVASVYLEFPADAAPDDGACAAAVTALSRALEELWP